MSLDEIEQIIKKGAKEDQEKGIKNNQGNLKKYSGIISLDHETDSVQLKKDNYKG